MLERHFPEGLLLIDQLIICGLFPVILEDNIEKMTLKSLSIFSISLMSG